VDAGQDVASELLEGAEFVLQAAELILLKSITIPDGMDWREAGRLGLVDAQFAEVLPHAAPDLRVQTVNLRTEDW